MTRLVRHLDREQLQHLAEVRVHLTQEARRHAQRRVLVLDQERHDLHDGVLDFARELEVGVPGQRLVGIPLAGGGLSVEVRQVVGPQEVLLAQAEVELGRARLERGSARCEPPTRRRTICDCAARVGIGDAGALGAAPAACAVDAALDSPSAAECMAVMTLRAAPRSEVDAELGR